MPFSSFPNSIKVSGTTNLNQDYYSFAAGSQVGGMYLIKVVWNNLAFEDGKLPAN